MQNHTSKEKMPPLEICRASVHNADAFACLLSGSMHSNVTLSSNKVMTELTRFSSTSWRSYNHNKHNISDTALERTYNTKTRQTMSLIICSSSLARAANSSRDKRGRRLYRRHSDIRCFGNNHKVYFASARTQVVSWHNCRIRIFSRRLRHWVSSCGESKLPLAIPLAKSPLGTPQHNKLETANANDMSSIDPRSRHQWVRHDVDEHNRQSNRTPNLHCRFEGHRDLARLSTTVEVRC